MKRRKIKVKKRASKAKLKRVTKVISTSRTVQIIENRIDGELVSWIATLIDHG